MSVITTTKHTDGCRCKFCGQFTAPHELCACRQREVIRQARKSQDIAELIARSFREQLLRGSMVAEVAYCEECK